MKSKKVFGVRKESKKSLVIIKQYFNLKIKIFFTFDEKMSSSIEFSLAGISPTAGKYSVQFIYNMNKNQVTLGPAKNLNQIATFSVTGLPQFLETNHGLYLGDIYNPRLYINNKYFYLEKVPNQRSTYNLVSTPNPQCFGFSPLTPGSPDVTPHNFPVDTSLTLVSNKGPITIFSPTKCTSSCTDCGSAICPENFTCFGGQCQTQIDLSSSAAFGIRAKENQTKVYTYSISEDILTIHLVSEDQISAKLETSNILKEKWFYADYLPGQHKLIVGQRYPLYVHINGDKRYITNTGNNVTYRLSTNPDGNTLTFAPQSAVNWGSFTLDQSEFANLYLPDNRGVPLALWQNSSVMGTPAVVPKDSGCVNCPGSVGAAVPAACNPPCTGGQTCNNGVCSSPTCTSSSQCSGGQVCSGGKCQNCSSTAPCPNGKACVGGKCQSCTSNTQCPKNKICSQGNCVDAPTPYWKTWWFWLTVFLIVLVILLLILALLYF